MKWWHDRLYSKSLYSPRYAPPLPPPAFPHPSVAPVSREAASSTPPMLKHWREVKAQHPHTILFYRVGDFYEMFNEDAHLAARILDITLTSRGDGVPLAGVPVKAATDYLRQLVAAGHRVAICEQVEDPKLAKGLVRREVVETLTPGALLQEGWLAGGRNNWMVAVGTANGDEDGGRRDRACGDRSQHRRVPPRDGGRRRARGIVLPPRARRGDRAFGRSFRRAPRIVHPSHRRARGVGVRRGSRARGAVPPLRARLARRSRSRSRTMRPHSAPPARCSATWASCSRPVFPISLVPSSAAPTPSSGSTT